MAQWKQKNIPKTFLSNGNTNCLSNEQLANGKQIGHIKKILHSYGFIQCMDNDHRLFFHFSEFYGAAMEVGDMVEFEMAYDKKTSKPIAVKVEHHSNNVEQPQLNNTNNANNSTNNCSIETRLTGVIATPAHRADTHGKGDATATADSRGSVSYQRGGETFFVPYSQTDLLAKCTLNSGDMVDFILCETNSIFSAKQIQLLKRGPKPNRHQGVVCSLRDNFGFIERSDVVREIFFHFSEWCAPVRELQLGSDVEFTIATRNGKEIATNIELLETGCVIFEDIDKDLRRGKIVKPLTPIQEQISKGIDKSRQSVNDALNGLIVYETVNGPIEIPYGDKDQNGAYTLLKDDIVTFNIATDRRDQLQRATNINLVYKDTFLLNNEKRDLGLVIAVKERYCFLRTESCPRLFAHLSELLINKKNDDDEDEEPEVIVDDVIEYSLSPSDLPTNLNRPIAQRLLILDYETKKAKNLREKLSDVDLIDGIVDVEACVDRPGVVSYFNNTLEEQKLMTFANDSCLEQFFCGDHIEFLPDSNFKTALLVRRSSTKFLRGYVAALKGDFGFIEYFTHDKEIFFHFSIVDDGGYELELGDDVEFTVSRKGGKLAAGIVRRSKEASKEVIFDETVRHGTIIRSIRICNPEQDEYKGEIEEDNIGRFYEFCVMSLTDKRDILQPGDKVEFQLASDPNLVGSKRDQLMAYKIMAKRERYQSTVSCLKGQFGFLDYEMEVGKKLFFHLSDVVTKGSVKPGDYLDFVIVQNKTGRFAASNLRKISSGSSPQSSSSLSGINGNEKFSAPRERPLRLCSQLIKTAGGQKLTVLRQPFGPDRNHKGFEPRKGPLLGLK